MKKIYGQIDQAKIKEISQEEFQKQIKKSQSFFADINFTKVNFGCILNSYGII